MGAVTNMIMVLSKTRGKLIVLIVSCDSREPQDAWAMANRLRCYLLRSCRPAQFLIADSDRGSVDDLASQRSLEDRSAPQCRSQHVSHQFPQNDALAIVDPQRGTNIHRPCAVCRRHVDVLCTTFVEAMNVCPV